LGAEISMVRRSAAVLALVLLVGGACSRTLPRVSGKVLDSRTGRPLAEVSVTAGSLEVTTGEDGSFVFTEVPEDTSIRFERANWHPRTATASERAMRVKLVPIPVEGKVTSALNGEGLLARLEGKIDEQTGPDGAFTVYGVGPGDRLQVSARFHETLEAPVDARRTLFVELKPARVDPESALVPVEGYAFTEMPRPLKDELAAKLYEDPTLAKATPLLAGRAVKRGKESIAVAIAVAVDPALAALPETSEAFFGRLARDARTRPETLTIAGTPVQLSQDRGGLKALAWTRYTVFFVLVGEDRPKLEGLAQALMEATR
jgi:hypothetical protein